MKAVTEIKMIYIDTSVSIQVRTVKSENLEWRTVTNCRTTTLSTLFSIFVEPRVDPGVN